MPGTLKPVVVLLAVLPAVLCSGQEDSCFTSGSVVGIVIATIVVTLVMGGLAIAALWYLWRQKTVTVDGKKPGSVFFGSGKNPPLENHPKKQLKNHQQNSSKESYAFDNPYFKDDEIDGSKLQNNNPDTAEKGQSGFPTDNGDVKNSPNKCNSKPKKNRPFSNLPFPNVFLQGSKKPRALDDTCIPKHTERVEVPLRGHDFTGLGFNICGNMRDGIFVKDVLHRGPASESGKIKAGDKIIGVTVSFGGMVYEDALTILSYASPYDVKLELEKTSSESDRVRHLALPTSSPGSKALLASSSFRTGQRLFHPLYRSQSIDDLTQIGKDNNFHMNDITASPCSKNGLISGPKRSQSIEASSGPKPRVHLTTGENETQASRKSSTSSCESVKQILPEQKTGSVIDNCSKSPITVEVKSSRFRVENVLLQKSAPVIVPLERSLKEEPPATLESKDLSSIKQISSVVEKKSESTDATITEQSMVEELEFTYSTNDDDKLTTIPQVPPRKSGGHGKRKAPAPPKSVTETAAIIHRNDEDDFTNDNTQLSEVELEDGERLFSHVNVREETDNRSGIVYGEREIKRDVHPVTEDTSENIQEHGEGNSSPKRKTASLGDLTKLDEQSQKKFPASSTILERAVSLDLQQSLPEENLVKQKRNLKTPTFEHPEDTSEEDCVNSLERVSSGSLKRWEGSWSKLQESPGDKADTSKGSHGLWPSPAKSQFSVITNGHSTMTHSVDEEPLQLKLDSDFPIARSATENSTIVTSTPLKNVVDSFLKDDVDLDDIPYLGDQTANDINEMLGEPINALGIGNSSGNSKNSIPISLSIPIIKPNFSNYEKLPSPLYPKSQNSDISTTSNDVLEHLTPTVERQECPVGQEFTNTKTAYKPVFAIASSQKPADTSNPTKSEMSALSVQDIVNGNGLELSGSSYGQYRTASEESSSISANRSSLDCSHLDSNPEKEMFLVKKHSLPEISGIKVHSGAAGFAKTLIISTPIEGESISLNDDLDSPPPKLEHQL